MYGGQRANLYKLSCNENLIKGEPNLTEQGEGQDNKCG